MKHAAQILLASTMVATTSFANDKVDMPAICKTQANYAVQALNLGFSDGSFADKHNPSSVKLKLDFKNLPITKIEFLGNCDEDEAKLKESWCVVAGGSPDVFKAEVAMSDDQGNKYPYADVIVTYNRGGCRVDEITRK